jgi:hypothetical protein
MKKLLLVIGLLMGCGGGSATAIPLEAPPDAPNIEAATEADPPLDVAQPEASKPDTADPDVLPTDAAVDATEEEVVAEGGQDVAAETSPEAAVEDGETGVCVPGSTQCSGNAIQKCSTSGYWQNNEVCPFVCSAGACTGVCLPGVKDCLGNIPRTCDATSQWQNGQVCPSVCSAGACAGSCVPASKQCSGTTAQTCQANGTWQDAQVCPFVCEAGSCAGICIPDETRCLGQTVQKCAQGKTWADDHVCSFTCVNGSCSGSCLPGSKQCNGNTLQICDASSSWQTDAVCPFQCLNAACTLCQPGALRCSGLTAQKCSTTTGTWTDIQACPFICSGGTCIGACTPGATRCQGLTIQLCDPVGVWQDSQSCPFVCASGACTGICTPGTLQCSGTLTQACTPQGQWSSVQCPAPPGASATCTGAGVCGFACNAGLTDCNSLPADGCEIGLASDGLNCGACGHSCGGGACSLGKCQPMVVASGLDYPGHLTVDGAYVYFNNGASGFASDHSIQKVLKTGGSPVSLYPNTEFFGVLDVIIADGTDLFWIPKVTPSTANLIRGTTTGGAPSTLVSGTPSPGSIDQDATSIFYDGFSSGPPATAWIYRKGKTSGSATTLVTSSNAQANIRLRVADGYVYWSGGADFGVWKTPTTGGAAITIVSMLGSLTNGIDVDTDYIYWNQQPYGTRGNCIWRYLKTGAPKATLVVDNGVSSALSIDSFVIDGSYVYYLTHTPYMIWRVLKTGGSPEQVATASTNHIVQDAQFVYWALSYSPAPNGAIMRVAK